MKRDFEIFNLKSCLNYNIHTVILNYNICDG
jgi:hypothetical protein